MNENSTTPTDTTNPKDILGLKKVSLRLVPAALQIFVAKVMALGAKKYGPYNWRDKKVRHTVYLEAAQRHILQVLDGEDNDEESGMPHEAHAAACMGIILDARANGCLIDDRPIKGSAARLLKELTDPGQTVAAAQIDKRPLVYSSPSTLPPMADTVKVAEPGGVVATYARPSGWRFVEYRKVKQGDSYLSACSPGEIIHCGNGLINLIRIVVDKIPEEVGGRVYGPSSPLPPMVDFVKVADNPGGAVAVYARPAGWRFVEYREVKDGDFYISSCSNEIIHSNEDSKGCVRVIVQKIPEEAATRQQRMVEEHQARAEKRKEILNAPDTMKMDAGYIYRPLFQQCFRYRVTGRGCPKTGEWFLSKSTGLPTQAGLDYKSTQTLVVVEMISPNGFITVL
jgi:hypothetical protein